MQRRMWIIGLIGGIIGLGLIGVWAASQNAVPEAAVLSTPTASHEVQENYAVGDCVRVTKPTYLRFGPGVDYPVMTNIQVRQQPFISVLSEPVAGLVCTNSAQCNPHDEGWWWTVNIRWPDTGDIDNGWLWQGEIQPCHSG